MWMASLSDVPDNKISFSLVHSRFPVDSHRAVNYRGAPWKAEVGRWLSSCDSIVTEIDIIEVGRPAKITAVVKEFVTMNLGNADVFMDMLELQNYHMGDGLFQFVQHIVTQHEQCAFVERERSIQIVQCLKHVASE
ncbi:hypothetical protein ACLOJK_016042 [Asimina triloba]